MTTAEIAGGKRKLLSACIAFALTATGGAIAGPDSGSAFVKRLIQRASAPTQSAKPLHAAPDFMAAAAAAPDAILTVTNCNDSGPGSLRAAAAGSGVVIADLSDLQCSTISLTSGAIVSQAQQLFVQGPGAAALTIDANHLDRAFYAKQNLSLDGLTITNGNAPLTYYDGGNVAVAFGGCVWAKQSLVIADSVVSGCQAGDFATADYAVGGGVIANVMALTNSTISGNHAYAPGGASGGGAYAYLALSVHGSTINGNAARSYYNSADGGGVFSGSDLALYGSVVSNNSARSLGGRVRGGGAFANGYATVDASTISGNSAQSYAGRVYAGGLFADFQTTIHDSTVSGNTAKSFSNSADGGGIYAQNVFMYDSGIADNLARSFGAAAKGGGVWAFDARGVGITVSDNSAHTGNGYASGGGLYALQSTVLFDSTVSGNSVRGSAARGGGLAAGYVAGKYVQVQANSAEASDGPALGGGAYARRGLYADYGRFAGNSVHASDDDAVGGGLAVSSANNTTNDVTLHLSQSTLDGNTVTTDCACLAAGGGVYIASATSGNKSVSLYASTISNNTASSVYGEAFGAGAYGPALNLANATVAYNVAISSTSAGGGLYVSTGDWLIKNSTIADNSATSAGGGITINSASSTGTLVSSIVFGNVADGSASDIHVPATVAGNNNLVGTVELGSLPADTLSSDPLLQPLADNGGPTETMALTPDTSPAINTGANPYGFINDQRGGHFARRAGAGVDIGAYEVQPAGGDIIFIDGFDDGPQR